MLTLTQTRLTTLLSGFLAVVTLSVIGSIVTLQNTAAAADYPGTWCSFKEAADGKSLTGACTDDKDNGTFDDVSFKASGKGTYSFTDSFWTVTGGGPLPQTSHTKPKDLPAGQTATETKCKPAVISVKATNDEATISGQYASTKILSGSYSAWSCTDLLAGKVELDRELVRLTAWRDTFYKNLLKSMTELECERFNEGSQNYKQCASGAATSVALCVGSNGTVWKTTKSYADIDEQKAAYKKNAIDCLDGKFSVATKAQITNAVNNAQSKADEAEGAIKDTEGEEADEETITTTCTIDGVGWIVCPVMRFIGTMNDAAFEFLEDMLSIRPAIITSQSTQNAWAAFRDIANVAFVIAFMIIVYSQLTSAGISNYGIKKMLPRIVVAAILVNVSFVITAIAVDISNIAGTGIHTLLKDSIAADVGGETSNGAWEEAIAGALAATTAIAITLIVVLFFVGPMALLALGMIVLILVARQALVILLIVVAPLAFVAYLLPNTEDWFKKWYKAFIAVLMVYPIVGAVFGASALASRVLSSVAADTEDSSLLQVIALGVLAIPLFAVPAILKGSLSAAGSIGARISGLADKAQGRATKRGMKRLGDATGDAKNRWNLAAANGKLGKKPWTPGGLTRRGMRRDFLRSSREAEAKRAAGVYTSELLDSSKNEQAEKYQRAAGGGRAGDGAAAVRAAARATQQGHKQYDEDVSAHKTTMTGLDHAQLMEILRDKTQSSERRAAAAGTIMSRDFRAGHLEALQEVGQIGQAGDDEHIGDIQKQMAYDMKEKPFALGDQAAGQLKIGTYGQVQPEITNADGTKYQPPQLGDLNEELRQRVEEKLSPASLAKMNPDEMTKIYEMSQKSEADGGLTVAQKQNLVKAIEDARSDPQYKGLIKPNEQKKHDKILQDYAKAQQDAAAATYGPNI